MTDNYITGDLDLITVNEVALLLRIKPQTVRLYLSNGRLPRDILCSKWHKKPMIFKSKLVDFIKNPQNYNNRLCF